MLVLLPVLVAWLVSITMAPRYKRLLDELALKTGLSKSQIVLNALHFQEQPRKTN